MTKPSLANSGLTFSISPLNNQAMALLIGERNTHLTQIESAYHVKISYRNELFFIEGLQKSAVQAQKVVETLYALVLKNNKPLNNKTIHLTLVENGQPEKINSPALIKIRKKTIRPRNQRQNDYLKNISHLDVCFGIGPAGTGKTYLAVACAAQALADKEVERIILVRPAVEAGEKLGFLPGDIGQKVDQYLRPLYDALDEILGQERVSKLIERGIIELAPLAYMRGRTLNDAFILLDEAQNTTIEQMKMFLTRMGQGSKMIITGDVTQIDLPNHITSGLLHVQDVLKNVKGVGFNQFTAADVVRHALVQQIVEAYASYE